MLCSFSNPSVTSPTSQLILQPFHLCTYVTAHSLTLPLLYLRHSSFSNPSVASPTSQFILQPSFLFSYVTSSSLNTPGEPPMGRTIMAGEHTWYLQDPQYRQSLHAINSLIAVGRVGNLLCGRPAQFIFQTTQGKNIQAYLSLLYQTTLDIQIREI